MAQYFNLTLDTEAPSGSGLSGLNAYYNGAVSVTVSATGASYMKVWVNKNATGSTSDTEIPSSWEAFAGSKSLTPSAEGTNYFHAIVMDEVGNQSGIVDSASFIYDTTAPTISAAEHPARVKVKEVNVKVTFSDLKEGIDAVSGVGSIKFTGTDSHVAEQNFELNDTDRTAGYKTCNVLLTITTEEESTEVDCPFSIVAIDRAGNSSSSISRSVKYDPIPASAVMTLMDKTCTSGLPSYVNSYDYGVQITSSDTDIASYKVWETSEPTEWSTWTGSPLNITNQTFSSGEGVKTIHAKLKDNAGNESTLTDVSTTVDTTAPTVTLSSDVSIISAQSSFDTVTFTIGGTDTHNMTEYELYVDSTKIKNGLFSPQTSPVSATVAVTEAEIVAKSAGEGTKSFIVKIKDVAGNWGESSALNITVDLTAPTGTVNASDYYKKDEAVTVTLSATDTGGSSVSKMKVWTGTTEPTEWENYATSKTFTLTDGNYTVSAKFMDGVGNAMSTATTDTFCVDTVAPSIASVSLDNVNQGYTKVTAHTATISANDATSGLSKMKVWGDITGSPSTEPTEWETFSATKSVTLTSGDGTKHIYVKAQDAAGNESTTYDYSVILDQAAADVSVTLFKADGVTPQSAQTNVREFVAHIVAEDSYESAGLQYKLTGDFAPQTTEWADYVEKSSTEKYMVIDNLTATTGDGTKTVTVLFRDKAGNEASAQASFVLDQTAPVVTITEPNYSKLSTVHDSRRDATGTAKTGEYEYTDFVTFTFSSNEKFIAHKVCVNSEGQTADTAVPIGTTHGSQNMSSNSESVESGTVSFCAIQGLDYAKAFCIQGYYYNNKFYEDSSHTVEISGQEGKAYLDLHKTGSPTAERAYLYTTTDGFKNQPIAKEVIVYVKDEAGTWSAVHQNIIF